MKTINDNCDKQVLKVIRALKQWNQRPYRIGMPSYLIETMISDYYHSLFTTFGTSIISEYLDLEVIKVFEYLKNNIYHNVNDPKGIASNINTLSWDDKFSLQQRLATDWDKAKSARQYEQDDNHAASIKKWSEIFGENFPTYTG